MSIFKWVAASLWLLASSCGSLVAGSSLRSVSQHQISRKSTHYTSDDDKTSSSSSSNFPQRYLFGPEEDQLRQFVGDAIVKIPAIQVSQDTWLGLADLNVTEFRCFNVTFGDIFLGLNMVENDAESDSFRLQVTDLVFQCQMEISWAYGLLDGAGAVSVCSDKNFL